MSTRDPILNALKLRFERLVLFIILSALILLALWAWVLLGYFDLNLASIWRFTKDAFLTNEQNRVAALILRGCGIVGVLTSSVMFLFAALWWKRSGDVHRRGTQLIDARDGRA